jgi:THO complex subunit 5
MDVDHSPSSGRTHVTDPRLLSVLDVSDQARNAALHFLDVFSKAALPAQSSANTPPDISHALAITRAQKPVFAYLTQLRARNRDMAYPIREDRATTTASRAEVDTLHLSLQNLQYENRHLAGEIAATENHPHTYQELDLVSEEEFLAAHPEWEENRKKKEDLGIPVDEEIVRVYNEDIQVVTEDVTAEVAPL